MKKQKRHHGFFLIYFAGFGYISNLSEPPSTGTATLEAKLLQQLVALREEVLYVILLDLQKAYNTLDRSRCLEFLEGYGVRPRARELLRNY